ncbi:MAG: hypothetical protein HZB43_01400 [candidate division Zixibacteria bacterium]|nr:hypothetical protein [candidate division Zixibacteria bacterium]
MDQRLNCWEIMNCGLGPNGAKAAESGLCPVASDTSSNGINRGHNGGRICWDIAGTLSGAEVQCPFVSDIIDCLSCDVYLRVEREEGLEFEPLRPE